MDYEHLLIERDGAVALVTINRPDKRNALSSQTVGELHRAMAALTADAGLRAIVLTGAGDRAFVAGADIGEIAGLSAVDARAYARAGQRVFDAIETLGVPVIAAINGVALGGGCELAMACTLRIAADSARFGQPEVNLGVIPGFAGTQRLPRLVGRGRAFEMVLTGEPIDAARAYDIGLVNRVVPAAELRTAAMVWAQALAGKAPVAVRYILDAVHAGAGMTLAEAQELEASLFGLAAATADKQEGTRAFLEKRPPVWTGR